MPTTIAGFDGLIVLGGPMHAGDDEGYPAFTSILSLIRECRQAGVPVQGLCLGAQLIARAFGQRVYLEPEERIMQMHEDSFELPRQSVLLMRNDACENQAFRIGASICGIQAHPEVTRKDARNFPRDCWDAMMRHFEGHAEAVERRVLSEVDTYVDAGATSARRSQIGGLT